MIKKNETRKTTTLQKNHPAAGIFPVAAGTLARPGTRAHIGSPALASVSECPPCGDVVMSAQGVVERASAELSKRINGLGLRNKHHNSRNGIQPGGGKASVMERVTNVFCGGNVSSVPPDKPSRFRSKSATGVVHPLQTPTAIRKLHLPEHPHSFQDLLQDDRFLSRFFLYFSSSERTNLAQVCVRWRDLLYRSPRYWQGLTPVIRCKELRLVHPQDRVRLFASLLRRGFTSVGLVGAADEDALDLVHSFPMATKHVHSLSLRCSSISDRGLEALLDHLQVSFCK